MLNRIKVQEIGHHRYKVSLNCGYSDWEAVEVKAINELRAIFKALRGKFFMQLFQIR